MTLLNTKLSLPPTKDALFGIKCKFEDVTVIVPLSMLVFCWFKIVFKDDVLVFGVKDHKPVAT